MWVAEDQMQGIKAIVANPKMGRIASLHLKKLVVANPKMGRIKAIVANYFLQDICSLIYGYMQGSAICWVY